MVQRMIGSQQLGTGGSSGYQYLRSTLRFVNKKNSVFNRLKKLIIILATAIRFSSICLICQHS